MTPEGLKQLKQDEGFKSHPYQDTVGKWTIGYGRNLDAKGITEFEAEFMLRDDVGDTEAALHIYLPWFEELQPHIADVLANMAFNMGVAGLLEFKNFLQFVKTGQYKEAAAEMLNSKWAQEVGARAMRLAAIMRY